MEQTTPATLTASQAERAAYALNLATCDLLAIYTANPPAFAWSPVKSSAIGARSVAR